MAPHSGGFFVSFTNNHTLGMNTTNSQTGDGGALFLAFDGTFTISATSGYSFTGNQAYRHGGAIYTETADITIQNVTISGDNRALNGNGGTIYSGGGNSVNILNSIITTQRPTQNKALNGGAVYIAEKGTLTIGSDLMSGDEYLGLVKFSGLKASERGGAIYLEKNSTLTITNADFENNTSTADGGAIFSAESGNIGITEATFTNNTAGGGGGALFAELASATITNALFINNSSEGTIPDNMGGGAVRFAGECSTGIIGSTFSGNRCAKGAGGAVFADGQISLVSSYFTNNRVESGGGGGALYINQTNGKGRFRADGCMFTGNSARPESNNNVRGGALYLKADIVEVDKCTFTKNSINGVSTARGGALYMHTTDDDQISTLMNSTFTENTSSGTTSTGGAISLYSASSGITITSCTITNSNTASDGSAAKGQGGGIYIESGTITISGTLAVGNIASGGGRDIWVSNGTVTSLGYNRIGIYGKGSGNTSWKETVTGSTTDREDEDNSWTTDLFFGDNVLDVNPLTDSNNNITRYPPLIGVERAGVEKVYLLTIMPKEQDALPADDWATGAIPNSRQYDFPQNDGRDFPRWNTDGIALNIGAVGLGGRTSEGGDEAGNIISRVLMSGVPNSLRSVGQTASLIAMVYYTNGKYNYGGPESEGFEEVIWRTSNPNIVSIDQSGNIVALRTTYTPSYATPGTVTIMVQTKRTDYKGEYAYDARAIRVTNDYTNLNVSPNYRNELSDYVYGIFEYDLSLMLADVSSSLVNAASFQNSFTELWNADSAEQITELTTSTPQFTTNFSYASSGGYRSAKSAAVNIDFSGRENGQVFPLVYIWNFTGEQLRNILGYDLSDEQITDALTEKIFSSLRIEFHGKNHTFPVVGSGGVKANDARACGALVLTKADANKGLHVELTAYLANVDDSSGSAELLSSSGNNKLLVVPDGANDGTISGAMWIVSGGTNSDTSNNNTKPSVSVSEGEGGSSGGGCEAMSIGLLGLVLMMIRKR